MTIGVNQQSDIHQWLMLTAIKGVSPREWLNVLSENSITLSQLCAGNWQPLAEENAGLPQKLSNRIAQANSSFVERSLRWKSSSDDHHIITYDSAAYPELLRQLSSPPLVLYVQGDVKRLSQPSISIVGSRRCSHSGKQIASDFAQQLSQLGWGIVSGMATGIDTSAHQGALSGVGKTIAVIGTGPDKVYPSRNKKLVEHVLRQGGAVVSEFWPGTPPRAAHFPRRNRIIAALSSGTLVVEAAIKSGTLITANLAIDLGREVFAVPGNIYSPTSAGCHYLIQQGAKLVFKVEDIIEEFSALSTQLTLQTFGVDEKSRVDNLATDELLDSVDFDITAVDIIAERNRLSVSEVLATLLEYELRGWVAAVPGGYIKLRGKKNVRHPHVSI